MDSKHNQKLPKPMSASQALKDMQDFCKSLGLELIHDTSKYKTSQKIASIHFMNKSKNWWFFHLPLLEIRAAHCDFQNQHKALTFQDDLNKD